MQINSIISFAAILGKNNQPLLLRSYVADNEEEVELTLQINISIASEILELQQRKRLNSNEKANSNDNYYGLLSTFYSGAELFDVYGSMNIG